MSVWHAEELQGFYFFLTQLHLHVTQNITVYTVFEMLSQLWWCGDCLTGKHILKKGHMREWKIPSSTFCIPLVFILPHFFLHWSWIFLRTCLGHILSWGFLITCQAYVSVLLMQRGWDQECCSQCWTNLTFFTHFTFVQNVCPGPFIHFV